jgi:hypothetical protein
MVIRSRGVENMNYKKRETEGGATRKTKFTMLAAISKGNRSSAINARKATTSICGNMVRRMKVKSRGTCMRRKGEMR